MKTEILKFQNKEGTELSAKIIFPADQKPKAYALFSHCFTCNKNLRAIKNISQSLSSMGFAVFLFDFTGLGSSSGEFENTNFSSNLDDLIAASDFLEKKYEAPSILIGHSLGGAAALFSSAKLDNIKAVVTIAAPFDPYHVRKLLKEGIEEINESGKATVQIGGRPFTIKKQFLDDLESQEPESTIKNLRKPLLILHSPQDNIVGIKNAAKIYTAAHHPKSFISLDGADHLLSKSKDSLYAGKMIASWVEKYLDLPEEKTIEGKSQIIAITRQESYTTEIKAGKHRIVADEPENLGGNNLGPSPYDLLAASLASCTSITLQMYAQRKNWQLDEAIVHVEHEKIHAEDCETCEKKSNKIDSFRREIELIGQLDEEQRNRLLEIAEKCPVHKSLHSEIKVSTKLKEG